MKKEKPFKCPHCHRNTVESITGKTQSAVMVHWENPKQPVVLQWAVSHFKCANCGCKPMGWGMNRGIGWGAFQGQGYMRPYGYSMPLFRYY